MGMKGYKGFSKGLICKDKQYRENTIFEEPEANICVNGMHFCTNPLDVLDYYPLIDDNGDMCEFAEVEALDETFTNDKKKYCTKKLKIGTKISLAEFIKASLNVTYHQVKEEIEKSKDELKEKGGDWSTLAGGYGSKLAGGYGSTLVGGDGSKLAGGDGSKLAGGYGSKLVGGDWSTLVGGDWSKLAGGYGSKLAGGYGSTLAGGEHSVMISENSSKAKGGIGSLIVLVERNEKGEIVNYKAIQIDGDQYEKDTWYQMVGGEIKKVEE